MKCHTTVRVQFNQGNDHIETLGIPVYVKDNRKNVEGCFRLKRGQSRGFDDISGFPAEGFSGLVYIRERVLTISNGVVDNT